MMGCRTLINQSLFCYFVTQKKNLMKKYFLGPSKKKKKKKSENFHDKGDTNSIGGDIQCLPSSVSPHRFRIQGLSNL